MTFDFEALTYALLVKDLGSFRKAAQALAVRPSVVSRRIRAFEDVIGVSLFQRRSLGAVPTIAGARILSRGRRIVNDVQDMLRTAHRSSAGIEGILCVGTVSSIAGGTARELLRSFLAAHPDVELSVVEGAPREHISEVCALKMDLGFIVDSPIATGCVVEPLWSEPVLVAVASDHRLETLDVIDWSDLANERFILTKANPGPDIFDCVMRKLPGPDVHARVELRPVGRDGLMAMVGLGRGVSFVAASEAGVTYPGVVFRPLAGETVTFSIVWSEQNDNPVLRRFLSSARQHVRKLVPLALETPVPFFAAPSQTLDPLP